MALPQIVLHDHPEQSPDCLDGLVVYARQIAKTEMARSFGSLPAFVEWSRMQPVNLDQGEKPQAKGCHPRQRARIWPTDGLNCFEATAHYLGVAMARNEPLVVHLYDVEDPARGRRHVFPAVQDLARLGEPEAVVLQTQRMQAEWWNIIADAAHGIGSGVLGAFGMGSLNPLIEEAWKQAPREYGLSKFREDGNADPRKVQEQLQRRDDPRGLALAGPTKPKTPDSEVSMADLNKLLSDPRVRALLQVLSSEAAA